MVERGDLVLLNFEPLVRPDHQRLAERPAERHGFIIVRRSNSWSKRQEQHVGEEFITEDEGPGFPATETTMLFSHRASLVSVNQGGR